MEVDAVESDTDGDRIPEMHVRARSLQHVMDMNDGQYEKFYRDTCCAVFRYFFWHSLSRIVSIEMRFLLSLGASSRMHTVEFDRETVYRLHRKFTAMARKGYERLDETPEHAEALAREIERFKDFDWLKASREEKDGE